MVFRNTPPCEGQELIDEEELSSIFYNAPIIMILLDEDKRIIRVNRQTESDLGKYEDELLDLRPGEAFRCLHNLDTPEGCGYGDFCKNCAIRNTVLRTFKNREGYYKVDASMTLDSDDGPLLKHFLVTTHPLLINGKNMVLVSYEDVTGFKQVYEELERINHELEFYQEVLNHDLNNINQISIGYIDLLRRTPLSEKQLEYLEKVYVSIKKNSFLLANITQLHMNKDMPLRSINLVKTITSAIDEVISIYPEKDVKIKFITKNYYVKANPLLKNVFFNLIENAVKYSYRKEVKIEITISNIGDQVLISIKDWGIGIPDSEKEIIFGKYMRLDDSIKGKGLGLYIVRQLVEGYRGKVWVEDNEIDGSPGGAIFNVVLLKDSVDEVLKI
ncbi:MAG: ATP-binding protein [Candidatus Hodarchaeota archaeon]